VLRRPRFDDFREGKMTGPVISLLSTLQDEGRCSDVDRVLSGLASHNTGAGSWGWLLELMHQHDVAGKLRKEISGRASRLAESAIGPLGSSPSANLAQLIELIAAPVC
jgi:hypothetical protein